MVLAEERESHAHYARLYGAPVAASTRPVAAPEGRTQGAAGASVLLDGGGDLGGDGSRQEGRGELGRVL